MVDRIPKKTYREAVALCLENSERLQETAKTCFKYKQYLASFLTGLASWEEIGKALIIVKYWDDDFIPKKKWDKELKVHEEKIRVARRYWDISLFEKLGKESIFANMIVEGTMGLVDDLDYVKRMIKLRTSLLYVNFGWSSGVWESPVCDFKKTEQSAAEALFMIDRCRYGLDRELARKNIKI